MFVTDAVRAFGGAGAYRPLLAFYARQITAAAIVLDEVAAGRLLSTLTHNVRAAAQG